MKTCSKCHITKNDVDFPKGAATCKACKAVYMKKYRQDNRAKLSLQHKEYVSNNVESISLYMKKYNEDYRKNNKEELAAYDHEYYGNHIVKKSIYRKNYQNSHKKEKNIFNKEKYLNDPIFRLRQIVSKSINRALKNNSSDKNNLSCLDFLGYSIQDLKKYLEKQFEPWMNWENQGIYNLKTWNDNDPSTWKWNIDHIIPHSTFTYSSMEDQEFKECWALSNLRPYSAKQNVLDGSTRVRH